MRYPKGFDFYLGIFHILNWILNDLVPAMDFDIHNQVQNFNIDKVYYMFKIEKIKFENGNNYM